MDEPSCVNGLAIEKMEVTSKGHGKSASLGRPAARRHKR